MTETAWVFPPASTADENGIVGIGADLEPATLLAAYSRGLFPMPVEREGAIVWWSPPMRAIIPVDELRVSRSLRRSMRRFTFTVNTAFVDVVSRCGDVKRPHGWIDEQMLNAYQRLHELDWAHSVETRNEAGELVGGIYGVGMAGFFAGESMFHIEADASKAALAHLMELLRDIGVVLFDVQWLTPHLESLGAIEIRRSEYLDRLGDALSVSADLGSIEEDPT